MVLDTINRNHITDRYYLPKPKSQRQNKYYKITTLNTGNTKEKTPVSKKKGDSERKTKTSEIKIFVTFCGIMKDRECGSIIERDGVIKKTPCVFSVWKDNKTVSFLPNFTSSALISIIKRYHKKAKKNIRYSMSGYR